MPIVIKEIHVNTVVEKRVVQSEEISRELYQRLKEELLEELKAGSPSAMTTGTRKER